MVLWLSPSVEVFERFDQSLQGLLEHSGFFLWLLVVFDLWKQDFGVSVLFDELDHAMANGGRNEISPALVPDVLLVKIWVQHLHAHLDRTNVDGFPFLGKNANGFGQCREPILG